MVLVTFTGAVLCVGHNGNGQLGVEDPSLESSMPVAPRAAMNTAAVSVAAGSGFSLVLGEGGDVWSW